MMIKRREFQYYLSNSFFFQFLKKNEIFHGLKIDCEKNFRRAKTNEAVAL